MLEQAGLPMKPSTPTEKLRIKILNGEHQTTPTREVNGKQCAYLFLEMTF